MVVNHVSQTCLLRDLHERRVHYATWGEHEKRDGRSPVSLITTRVGRLVVGFVPATLLLVEETKGGSVRLCIVAYDQW